MRSLAIVALVAACGGSSVAPEVGSDPTLDPSTTGAEPPTTTSSDAPADTTGELDTTSGEPGADEDRDVPDATFRIEPCDDWMCAVYDADDDDADRSCPIAPTVEWSGTVEYGLIGQHHPGPLPTGFAHYLTPAARQRTAIVDLNDCTIAATADVPVEHPAWAAYFGLVRGPGDLKYPFMAPQFPFASSPWTFLCLYRGPSFTGGAACGGTGFQESSVIPNEVGEFWTSLGKTDPVEVFSPLARGPNGFLYDLDADGFEDIHLSWEFAIQSFSGQTGAPMLVTSYDVARDVTPPDHVGFHSGRPFGGYTAFRDSANAQYVLHVGGNGVGAFFWPCAESRYVAMLTTSPGPPPTRSLWWSDYYGFFPLTDLALEPSIVNLSRFHGCIHRIGDGIAYHGPAPFIVINWFESLGSIGLCPTCDNARSVSGKNP